MLAACASMLAACGGTTAQHSTTPAPAPSAPLVAEASAPILIDADHHIDRLALNETLDAGIGRFLSNVETEPAREGTEFVGFRVVRFFEQDPRYANVDLHVGDTITRVNGRRIQRPEDAMTVWSELRVATELLVEYVRDGERREIRYAIIN